MIATLGYTGSTTGMVRRKETGNKRGKNKATLLQTEDEHADDNDIDTNTVIWKTKRNM